MSAFDEDLFLKGLEQRKSTLGAEYVEKNLAAADDFTRPFQEAMTAWCCLQVCCFNYLGGRKWPLIALSVFFSSVKSDASAIHRLSPIHIFGATRPRLIP